MSTIFDDAERFLDLRTAGWQDPEVDPFEMIDALIAAQYESQEGLVSTDDRDFAVETASREAAEALKDPTKWDLDALTHEQLVRHLRDVSLALADAARRERQSAVLDAEGAIRAHARDDMAALVAERNHLREQVTAMFKGEPMPANPGRRPTKEPRRKRASKEAS